MIAPVWYQGALGHLPAVGEQPLVWLMRLDDPATAALAGGAALRENDLRDLAGRSQAAMRGLRRQLTRLLLARLAGCHPDSIALRRGPAGEVLVDTPEGWHISVAGRWPHAVIGVARQPLGVDLEPEDAPPPPEDALTPGERNELTKAPDAALVARWTAKEAHAKALGIASRIEGGDIHTWQDGLLLRARSSEGETIGQLRHQGGLICAVAVIRKP
ncbi:4'-phosphopantetheinyl transferase superfamily protein [Novosphingobium terrae]|uniref:4'-phosphopantetheinyl transferase superfamily protein n=1 Tax=Novosphingobium terrae TaxID=2726189 RepID=UPI00197F4306|nr:4'-phosphopantetheinyl transferase family protein [Novosphingobium terrae]